MNIYYYVCWWYGKQHHGKQAQILYLYVLRYKVDCNTLVVTMLIHNV